MSIDANTILNLQNTVAGDNTKPLSTIDTLASLKALNFFAKGGDDIDPTIGAIAQNEIAYLKAGMEAINRNPMLSLRFGNDLNASMTIAALLKQRNAQRIYENTLDVYAKTVPNREAMILNKSREGQIVDFGFPVPPEREE